MIVDVFLSTHYLLQGTADLLVEFVQIALRKENKYYAITYQGVPHPPFTRENTGPIFIALLNVSKESPFVKQEIPRLHQANFQVSREFLLTVCMHTPH